MRTGVKKNIKILMHAALIAAITTVLFHITQSHYKNFSRGQRYYQQNRFDKALPYLSKAFTEKPTDFSAGRYLVVTYDKLGQKEQAIKTLRALEGLGEWDNTNLKWLADLHYSLGQYAEAEAAYQKLFESQPMSVTAQKLAEVLAWQKKYPQAIELLREFTQRSPHANTNQFELLADIYTWNQNYDEAINAYRQLLTFKQGEGSKTVLLKLADTMRYAGRDEEALEIYTQYLREAK